MKQSFKLSILAILLANTYQAIAVNQPLPNGDEGAENAVERIIVTATRKETLDTDLAMSVHGIGKEELQMDNGQHVAESLNSISGVLIDQLSGGQGHKAAIRMPINVSGYYLYLQDNVPLQSPAFFNHNALWWSSFNSNVARMEVLKGAGTALYGSGAVAATVNILSEGVSDTPETSMDVMLGEDRYGKVQVSHSNRINDDNGFRASASYLTNDGWRDHTGSERAEINLRHEYEISNKQRLVTSFVASDLEQEMASGLKDKELDKIFESDWTDSGLSDEVLASDPLRKTQYMKLSSQWDYDDNENYYSMIPYLRYRTNDYTATWNQNMPKVESQVVTFGLLGLVNFEHSDSSETTIGFDLELTEGDQLSYQPLDHETEPNWKGETDFFSEGELFYDDTTRYSSLSPYFQHKRALTERLDLTVGARYDYAKYEFDNHLGVFGDIGHGKISIEDRDDDFSHLSPKASLNYHLSETSSTYFRYANSFRIPTAGSLYHLTTKDSGEAKAVDPETSDTFEIGYKANFDNIIFDAAIYYMDVDDGIVHAYNTNGQRYLTNASRVIHKGLEAALDWTISQEFNISLAYSKSKHEFDEHEDYSGNEMKMAPDYIANARLRYLPSYLAGFSGMLEVQSIGEYWMDDTNSTDPETGLERIYGGYTIANLKARYEVNSQLSLHARVLNLTDKVYAQEAEYRYGKYSIAPGAPRTVYVGVNYQW
ncbi:TonB-dependent receptor [Litorilituus lipolyticus]|uniref:TonB-dependent receptor n=1 Tax=Litorilituus lipolyticus TaxID=2491017 RepID=A0A502KU60_9GAMM|nr:TonB-dependent receptor [Litorilituus lipolyticus]TPH15188.1 TonB-dependent receptor [Litorilituus lipolyticus]